MSFRVVIQETSQSFEVAAHESVLQAAMRQGVKLAHECTFGGCGTCRVKLIQGVVDYEEFPMALTPEEANLGYALACQARPSCDLIISAGSEPQFQSQRCTAVVSEVEWLTREVANLRLQLPDMPALEYLPGQYMNLHLADGSHRSFSMASLPNENHVDFHVRRIPGGQFTDAQLESLKPGDRLDVELPLGNFRFHSEDYRPILMVATGTGLAPIKSMLESLMDDDDCPPVWLYWGMRSEGAHYLDAQIRSWTPRLYEFQYHPVVSRPSAAWQGRRGHVQDAVLADLGDLSEYSIYMCGSPAMISDAKQAFLARGAVLDHIYTDGFSFQHASHESAVI
jgi:CDP-4-dehydro-6-deoxyglucose reductase, E3